MSHCVPDWDGSGGELDAIIPTIDYLPPVKEKWESLPQKRSHLSVLASVRDHDVVEPHWTENVDMQGHGSRGSRPQWQSNYAHNWSGGQDSEDAVTPSKPPSSSPGKEANLAVNDPAVDTPVNTYLHDDEMESWLQYPLDDSLERNYCSEFFGDLPNNMSSMQFVKDSFAAGQSAAGRCSRNPGLVYVGSNSPLNRASNADAAMAMGAGRAAGLLPQAGAEVFSKVRTTMQQPYAGKWPPSVNPSVGKTLGAVPSSLSPASRTPAVAPNLSSPMLPPKSQAMPFQPARNFSHFRPAGVIKANLQTCLEMSHGASGATRLKTPFSGNRSLDASTSSGSSIAESTTTRERNEVPRKDTDVHVEGSEGQQQSLGTESSWPATQNSLSSKDAVAAVNSDVDRVDSKSKLVDQENHRNSSVTSGGGVAGRDKHVSQGGDVQEAPEPTITSSSGGSGTSADRGKEAACSGKRRTREGEESECQSEDGEDEMADLKKPQQRGGTTKRSRAAEVHNLSERRRRDRINEKMKALQELIPNSNKTDKASMLDEAIEYLKMLQLQLQMMSMRSGPPLPSMVMPTGMQHLQIPQMGPMPAMGMGMGMGMGPMVGMGMPMMDMGIVAPGRPPHMIPLPSHGGPSHSVSATSPAVSMVDSHDHRLQGNSVMDSVNVYLARQHQQLQLPQQHLDAYNAYMMHQHQQHQQHQLHHMPNNIGGGPQ